MRLKACGAPRACAACLNTKFRMMQNNTYTKQAAISKRYKKVCSGRLTVYPKKARGFGCSETLGNVEFNACLPWPKNRYSREIHEVDSTVRSCDNVQYRTSVRHRQDPWYFA